MNHEVSSSNCPQEPNENQSDDLKEEIRETSNFAFLRLVCKDGPCYYEFWRKGEGSLGIWVADETAQTLNELFERLKQETDENTKDDLLAGLSVWFNMYPQEIPYTSEESLAKSLRGILKEAEHYRLTF